MAGIGDSKGFSCSRCCSPWRYYEPADLFGAGAAWGLKENLPARQGFGEYGTCHETLLVAGPALLLPVCDSCLKDTCCLQAQPSARQCKDVTMQREGMQAAGVQGLQRPARRRCCSGCCAGRACCRRQRGRGNAPGGPRRCCARAGRCCRRRSPRATPRSVETCAAHTPASQQRSWPIKRDGCVLMLVPVTFSRPAAQRMQAFSLSRLCMCTTSGQACGVRLQEKGLRTALACR